MKRTQIIGIIIIGLCLNTMLLSPLSAQNNLKVLSYNVLKGFQQDSLHFNEYHEWVNNIDPDIVGYQEMNGFTQKGLEEFAKKYGHHYAVMSKLEGFPVALSSKYPIINVQKVVDNMWHAYLYAQIKDFHVFVIHFSPFSYEKRQFEIKQVLAHAALLPEDEKILIMGDFNSLSEEDSDYHTADMVEAMKKSEEEHNHIRNLNHGKIDYTVIGSLQKAGFKDTFWLKNRELIYSVPTIAYGKPTTKRIDFIWTNDTLSEDVISSTVIHDKVTDKISDHYPVLVEFKL